MQFPIHTRLLRPSSTPSGGGSGYAHVSGKPGAGSLAPAFTLPSSQGKHVNLADYRGRSVVISGDTRKWPPLAEAARGADVLIHEAQNSDMTRLLATTLSGAGQARQASIMTDTLSYHTPPVEAAEIAKAAGVKVLILSHLTQAGLPFFTPDAFTRGVDAVFSPWRLARDGMTIELPVGTTEIRYGQF